LALAEHPSPKRLGTDGMDSNLPTLTNQLLLMRRLLTDQLQICVRYFNDPAASQQISWSRDLVEAVDPNSHSH
jgi:hypothetical protein